MKENANHPGLRARAWEGTWSFPLTLLTPCFVVDFLSCQQTQVTSEPCFQQHMFQNPELSMVLAEPGSRQVLSKD